jgi:hypothetical protein
VSGVVEGVKSPVAIHIHRVDDLVETGLDNLREQIEEVRIENLSDGH